MKNKLWGFNVDKVWEYENGFYLTSDVTRLAKILAHYELYRSIIGLPGHIVECGVFKGISLIRFATFREVLESPYSRKIIGFDVFGKFPYSSDPNDLKFIKNFEKHAGNGINIEDLNKVFERKAFKNYELIQGDVTETVPEYVLKHPEFKIALLHIDLDIYAPTKIVLKKLYERVVKNGIIVFDDFGTVSGETKAIDEYFLNQDIVIEKLPISHIPAYIRK